MTLEDIRKAILKLTPEERTHLRAWLARLDSGPGTTVEKVGRLAGRAFANLRKRVRDS